MKVGASILLILISLFPVSCKRQTRLFKDIEVRGRLVNFFSKEPLANAEVKLRTNDIYSSSIYGTARIELASATTESDGSFVLKSKASRRTSYHIEIVGADHFYAYSLTDTFFTAHPGKIFDIGEINTGEHQYWYRVLYRSTSGGCGWVPDASFNNIRINAGTDTAIMYSVVLSYSDVKETNRMLTLWYQNGNCNNPERGLLQRREYLITAEDTMRLEVEY